MKKIACTVKELSEMLGIHKDTIYRLCREDKIPHRRVGERIIFHLPTIESWLQGKDVKDELGGN